MIRREKRDGGEAKGIEKRSRERIEKRKRQKELRDDNLKRRRNITTCLCLLFSFLNVLYAVLLRRHEYATRFCSATAVKF